MSFIKRHIENILVKMYAYVKAKHDKFVRKNNEIYNNQQSVIGEGTIVYASANIHNNQGNQSRIKIGKECLINGELFIYGHGGEIEIGDHVFIGRDTKIWSAKRIMIGNRVLIAHGVNIHDNNSHPLDSSLRHKDYMYIYSNNKRQTSDLDLMEESIIIGDDVWIGFNATIMKGVTIGQGAIIGANTVITGDVPSFAVVVGTPQRIIKYVN